jgi:hypothetical protein
MRVVWSAEAPPTGRDVVHHGVHVVQVHHAPSIRLRDLDSFITLSLESHRHLRLSIPIMVEGGCIFPLRMSYFDHYLLVEKLSCASAACYYWRSPSTPPPWSAEFVAQVVVLTQADFQVKSVEKRSLSRNS